MLLVDARGVPLSIIVTAANRHDISQLVPTLDALVVHLRLPPRHLSWSGIRRSTGRNAEASSTFP